MITYVEKQITNYPGIPTRCLEETTTITTDLRPDKWLEEQPIDSRFGKGTVTSTYAIMFALRLK